MVHADLLIRSINELVTLKNKGPKKGPDLDRLDGINDAAVAVEGGRILDLGPTEVLEKKYARADRVIDGGGRVVMPGFVDPHTHPVFNATREAEFDMRLRGRTYVEITEAGGGIFSSVRSMRECTTERLARLLRERCDRFIALGTTTIEAKSGYGLNRDDEIRALQILAEVNESHALDVVPTFLGAHQIPPEYADRREDYIQALIKKILPEVREQGLAEYCDIFTEDHVYTVEESQRIMQAAKELGFRLRFHADELSPLGGAELAARMGAATADHLVMASDAGIAAMAKAGVIPVILPATVFSLNLKTRPRVREMIDQGLAVALATDFNPGTSFTQSMPQVIGIACCMLRMTVAQAINAAVVNSAHSLGRGDRIGSIEAGKEADLIVLDCPSHLFLGYQLGWNPVETVIKAGRVVYERPSIRVTR